MNNIGYIGVDPGAPLALALISPKGRLAATARQNMLAVKSGSSWSNSPELICATIQKWQKSTKYPVKLVIERVSAMPGEGVVSVGKFVGSMWLVKGIGVASGIRYLTVAPSVWKRFYGLPGGPDNKDLSRQKALELWPKEAHRFKHKNSHNVAEAGLIALWALQNDKIRLS